MYIMSKALCFLFAFVCLFVCSVVGKTQGLIHCRPIGLERQLSCSEYIFVSQRSRVQFPAPMSVSSRQPVTPAPGGAASLTP